MVSSCMLCFMAHMVYVYVVGSPHAPYACTIFNGYSRSLWTELEVPVGEPAGLTLLTGFCHSPSCPSRVSASFETLTTQSLPTRFVRLSGSNPFVLIFFSSSPRAVKNLTKLPCIIFAFACCSSVGRT